ncbi:hypothetical protein Q1695_008452 [Nippostrongylus brasiliensis]|nr:hypothetical protein Q1695_008452 [Nippostrongylus brasiliensis]
MPEWLLHCLKTVPEMTLCAVLATTTIVWCHKTPKGKAVKDRKVGVSIMEAPKEPDSLMTVPTVTQPTTKPQAKPDDMKCVFDMLQDYEKAQQKNTEEKPPGEAPAKAAVAKDPPKVEEKEIDAKAPKKSGVKGKSDVVKKPVAEGVAAKTAVEEDEKGCENDKRTTEETKDEVGHTQIEDEGQNAALEKQLKAGARVAKRDFTTPTHERAEVQVQ